MRRRGPDLPAGVIVVVTFLVVALAFAGLFKAALGVVLVAFAVGTVMRVLRGTR
jgi:hypothetical protein